MEAENHNAGERLAAPLGSAIPRHEQARRQQMQRALKETPGLLAETLARHYASLATTAVQLRECIMAKRAGAENMDGAISHYVARLRQCHINDFGVEASWPNAEVSDRAERGSLH